MSQPSNLNEIESASLLTEREIEQHSEHHLKNALSSIEQTLPKSEGSGSLPKRIEISEDNLCFTRPGYSKNPAVRDLHFDERYGYLLWDEIFTVCEMHAIEHPSRLSNDSD